MHTTITITPAMIFGALISISAFVVAMYKLVEIITKVIQKTKAPEAAQDKEIANLKEDYENMMDLIKRDDKRLRVLEDGMNVLIKGQLALLGHAVEGNNADECKEARTQIYEHLMNK